MRADVLADARLRGLALVDMLACHAYPATLAPRQVADYVDNFSAEALEQGLRRTLALCQCRTDAPLAARLALRDAGLLPA